MEVRKSNNNTKPRRTNILTKQLNPVIAASLGFPQDEKFLDGNSVVNKFIKTTKAATAKAGETSTLQPLGKSFFPLELAKKKKDNSKLGEHPRDTKKPLSLQEKRRLGLYKIYRNELKFKDFIPLHNLWKEYISSALNLDHLSENGFTGSHMDPQWQDFSIQLFKADFHGAFVTIVRSTCSSLVGLSGIIVFDTKNTYKLLGKDNIARTIPKMTNVFSFEVDKYQFTFFGRDMCIRPALRSVKKRKKYLIADL